MSFARFFVFNTDDHWVVALDGRTVRRYRSRDEALGGAIVIADLMGAMHYDADVLVEGDARLDVAWSFNADRRPAHEEIAR